jgi:ubiquitin C-terminal hydrolase
MQANDWWSYSKKRDDSVVCDYFQGQMECTIVCSECKFKSVSFDNFWGLPVSFGLKGSSLADLIAANFCTEHRLEDYSCEKCKKAKTCSKTVKLFRLPIVLVVQLKRFGYGWSRKQKIKDKVAVPLQLSLKEVISS